MAWTKCWSSPTLLRGTILVHDAQASFHVLIPLTGLWTQCDSDKLSILHSLCNIPFLLRFFRGALYSIKGKPNKDREIW